VAQDLFFGLLAPRITFEAIAGLVGVVAANSLSIVSQLPYAPTALLGPRGWERQSAPTGSDARFAFNSFAQAMA